MVGGRAGSRGLSLDDLPLLSEVGGVVEDEFLRGVTSEGCNGVGTESTSGHCDRKKRRVSSRKGCKGNQEGKKLTITKMILSDNAVSLGRSTFDEGRLGLGTKTTTVKSTTTEFGTVSGEGVLALDVTSFDDVVGVSVEPLAVVSVVKRAVSCSF